MTRDPNDPSTPLSQPTLGETLRLEREKRGITIEQVASATKINVKSLHALESNQYQELPAAPFVRGFVAAYARFIGLNPNDLLIEYKEFIQERSKSERVKKDAGHTGYAFERRETDDHRRNLWISIGSFILILAVAFLIFKPQLKRKHHHADKLREAHSATAPNPSDSPRASESPQLSTSPSSAAVVLISPSPAVSPTSTPAPSPIPTPSPSPKPSLTPSPKASPSPKATASPSPSPSPSASSNPDPFNSGKALPLAEVKHRIVFKAKEKSWVRYQVDDRPVTKFILKKGGILFLRAKTGIIVQFGNPEAITFSANGGQSRSFTEKEGAFEQAGNLTMRYQSNSSDEIESRLPEKEFLPRIEPIAPQPSATLSP